MILICKGYSYIISPKDNSKEEHLENQNLLKSRTVSFMLQAIISY